jgi:hypothetical protein
MTNTQAQKVIDLINLVVAIALAVLVGLMLIPLLLIVLVLTIPMAISEWAQEKSEPPHPLTWLLNWLFPKEDNDRIDT